jgi:MFS family permease
VPAPASYGVCFVCAAVCMALSYAALVVVREPAATTSAPAVGLREYLSRIPVLLSRDSNLAWFLAARAFALVGTIGGAFYTVYALRVWDAPAAQAGVFTTYLFVGQMAGNAVLGWLADRRGHRLVIMLGVGSTLAGNLVAIAAPGLGAFGAVFVMLGIQIAATNVSNLNVMLEFAPGPAAQPTYIGLGTTLLAPIAFGAPLAAGLVADAVGFLAVFAVGAVAAGVALGLLLTRVRDPRAIAQARALTSSG